MTDEPTNEALKKRLNDPTLEQAEAEAIARRLLKRLEASEAARAKAFDAGCREYQKFKDDYHAAIQRAEEAEARVEQERKRWELLRVTDGQEVVEIVDQNLVLTLRDREVSALKARVRELEHGANVMPCPECGSGIMFNYRTSTKDSWVHDVKGRPLLMCLNDECDFKMRYKDDAALARVAKYETAIKFLWDLLDDIDTASDMFKNDYATLSKFVYDRQRRRWKLGELTDGHGFNLDNLDVSALAADEGAADA